jgi:arabinofuranosyltransferase
MPWSARPAVEVLLLALVAGFGGGAMAAAAPLGFPLDDAWIHLQIARNFSTGHGFGLNSDEPVSLSTAPLWTLLVALLHLLPWSIVASVKAVGALLLFGNALCTRLLARELGLPGSWALLAGLVVALTPRFLWASQSGMEILLYTLLASGGLVLHMRTFVVAPSLWGTGLWASAVLARPECAILFPLAVVDRWRTEGRLLAMVALYWKHVLLFILLLVPWVLFNLRYGSGPLPNTFYAKVGSYGLMGALADGAWLRVGAAVLLYPLEQMQELVQFSVENNVLLTVAAPLGLLALMRRGKETSWLIPLVLIGFPILRGLLAPFKGATFQQGRYAAYLVPLLTVVGLVGLREAWTVLREQLQEGRARRWRYWLRRLVWVCVLGNVLVLDLRQGRDYAANVADINQMHVAMGQWLAANTPAEAVVASNDIGAIAYFSERRLLDIVGLATPEVLGYLQPGVAADLGVLRYLEKTQPDYLVLLPNWYPQLAEMHYLFRPVHTIEVAPGTIAGGTRLVAYRTVWADD